MSYHHAVKGSSIRRRSKGANLLSTHNYWTGKLLTRRAAIRAASVGGGVAALSLVGCGSDDSGAKGSGQVSSEVLDSTKGKPGGVFHNQEGPYPLNFNFIETSGGGAVLGASMSSLL